MGAGPVGIPGLVEVSDQTRGSAGPCHFLTPLERRTDLPVYQTAAVVGDSGVDELAQLIVSQFVAPERQSTDEPRFSKLC